MLQRGELFAGRYMAGEPAPLAPGHGRAELEATTPAATPAPSAKAGKKAGAAPLPTTLVAERLLRQSTTPDFGGSSRFVRSRRNHSKQRMLRGVWGAAGFVTGSALTALVLHGGAQPPARLESAAALSPGAAALEPLDAPPAAPAPVAPPAPAAADAAPRADAAPQAAAAPPADSAKPPAAPPANAAPTPAAPKVVRAPAPKRPAGPLASARPEALSGGPGLASGAGTPAEALDIELSR